MVLFVVVVEVFVIFLITSKFTKSHGIHSVLSCCWIQYVWKIKLPTFVRDNLMKSSCFFQLFGVVVVALMSIHISSQSIVCNTLLMDANVVTFYFNLLKLKNKNGMKISWRNWNFQLWRFHQCTFDKQTVYQWFVLQTRSLKRRCQRRIIKIYGGFANFKYNTGQQKNSWYCGMFI